MNTPVREGETIEGSRTMRNRPYPVLKCSTKPLIQSTTLGTGLARTGTNTGEEHRHNPREGWEDGTRFFSVRPAVLLFFFVHSGWREASTEGPIG